MRKLMYILTLATLALLVTSCGSYRSLDLNRLTTGMTKAQVEEMAGPPQRVLAVNNNQNGYQEVLEYSTARNEVYALEFWNDYLTGYEYLYDDIQYIPAPAPPMYMPPYGRPIIIVNERPGRPPHYNRPPTNHRPATRPQQPRSKPRANESSRPNSNSSNNSSGRKTTEGTTGRTSGRSSSKSSTTTNSNTNSNSNSNSSSRTSGRSSSSSTSTSTRSSNKSSDSGSSSNSNNEKTSSRSSGRSSSR